ncbi:MAG: hypothetical protein H3C47_03510 [Candidatus Cloacimonetes bacterium]|nr:hypothetical protein [Candidatus Cloacimonadota bacterium]
MLALRLLFLLLFVVSLKALPVREKLLGPGQIPGSSHVLISNEELNAIKDFEPKVPVPARIKDMKLTLGLGQAALFLSFKAQVTSPEPMQLLPAGFALTKYTGPELIYDADTWKLQSDTEEQVDFVAVFPIPANQRDLDLLVPFIYSWAGELNLQLDGDWLQPRVYLESLRTELAIPVMVSTEGIQGLRIRARRQGLAQMDPVKPVSVVGDDVLKPQIFAESSHRLRLSRSEVVYEMVTHLTISRHPVREISLLVPQGFEVSEVTGLNGLGLSFVKHNGMIRFHRDQRDLASFKMVGRFVRENPDIPIHLPGLIRMHEVASQRSFLALEASDVLRVREVRFDHTERVSRVDVTELPSELKPENGEPVLYACRILGDSGSVHIDSELFTRLEPVSLVIAGFFGVARFQADRGAIHSWTYNLQVEKPGSYIFEFPKNYEFRSARLNGSEVPVFSEGEGKIGVDLKSSQILRSGENQSYNLLQNRQMIGGLQNQKLELSLIAPPVDQDKVKIDLPLPAHAQNISFTVQVEEDSSMVSVRSSFENPGWERAQALVRNGLQYARFGWVIILAVLLFFLFLKAGWVQAFWLGELNFYGLIKRLVLGLFLGSWVLLLSSQVLQYYDILPLPQSTYTWSHGNGVHMPSGEGFFLYSLMGRQEGHWVEVDFGASIFPLGPGLQLLFSMFWAVGLVILIQKNTKLFGPGLGFCALFWVAFYLMNLLSGFVWLVAQPLMIGLWGMGGIFFKIRRQIAGALVLIIPTYAIDVQIVPQADGSRLHFVSEADYEMVFSRTTAKDRVYPAFKTSNLYLYVKENRLFLDMVYSRPHERFSTMELDSFYSGYLHTDIEPKPETIFDLNGRRILDYGSKLPDSLRLTLVLMENVDGLLATGYSVRLKAPSIPISFLELPCDHYSIATTVPQVSQCQYALPSSRDFTVTLKKLGNQIVTEAPTTTRMEFRGMRILGNHKVQIKEGLAEIRSRLRMSIEGNLNEALQVRLPEGLLIKSVSASGAEILDWSSSLEKGVLTVNFRPGTAGQVTLDMASEKALGTRTTTLTPFSVPQANSLESTWNFEPEVGLEFRLDMSEAMKKSLRQRNPAKTILEMEEIQTEAGLDKTSAFYLTVVAREGINTFSAFVDLLEMYVYLAPDGTMYLRRSLVVRNHAEQFLVLKPMTGEELLTARIQGQRATIGIQGENWLLPLKMVLSPGGEVIPFSLELTTKIPTSGKRILSIQPADLSLPIAQATLRAGTDSSRTLKMVNPHWHPGGMNPEFQGVLPDSFQGRLLSSAADMPVPIPHESLQRIAWFLTPAFRNVSMDIEVSERISPNWVALIVAGVAIFCLLPGLKTLIPILFLLPFLIQMPFAYSGAVYAGALLMILFRVCSQPMVWLKRLFPGLILLLSSFPSYTQDWKTKLVDWNKVSELTGYELIPKSRLPEFVKALEKDGGDRLNPLPVIGLDISEESTGVLRIDHEVFLSASKESGHCVDVLSPGLVYHKLPALPWKKQDSGDGVCIELKQSAQRIQFTGWYYFGASEARIELPEAFIEIRSLKGQSSLRLLSERGEDSLAPYYLFRIKQLKLAYQNEEKPAIVEEVKDFKKLPSQATEFVNYQLSVGSSAHNLKMSLHVSVLHQSLQKIVLPVVEGFRLHQLTIHPPQPFQLSGNTLLFPGGILGSGRIHLEGEILATGTEVSIPKQNSELISLGGELVLTVRENLKVKPENNPEMVEQSLDSDLKNLSEPVLGHWRFSGIFPGFKASINPLPSLALGSGLAESLSVKTLMIGRGRVAQAYQARIRVPENLELSLPLQLGTELMGVYINSEPAKAFMNESGFLAIQFPVSLSDQVIQLEVKLLEKVQESRRLWLTLPESLKALKTSWEVWYPEEIHVKSLQSNLNHEKESDPKNWIQANDSEVLKLNLFGAMLITFSVCMAGFILWLLYRITAFLFSALIEVLQGIKSPVFQLWLKRIVGVGMVVVLGVLGLGLLSFGLSFSKKTVEELIPNVRRARERSIEKRNQMQNLMQSNEADYLGSMPMMEDSQRFEGKAEMEFSAQRSMSMRKSAAPPPPASPYNLKPSRLDVGQAIKKGNIKPVQVVLPALPNKKILYSEQPLSEAGFVRIELSDTSFWFENPQFQTLLWLVVIGIAFLSLLYQKLALLLLSGLCLGFLPFPQVILSGLLLPVLVLGLLKRKALWIFLILCMPCDVSSSTLYQIWDAQNRKIVFEDQVLVQSLREKKPDIEESKNFCHELKIEFLRLIGQDLAEVSYTCKLNGSLAVLMSGLPRNAGLLTISPSIYPYKRDGETVSFGPFPDNNKTEDLVIRFTIPVKPENYGDVLRVRLPFMASVKSTVDAGAIGRFPQLSGMQSGDFSGVFPTGKIREDLLLLRRVTRWRPGVASGREVITGSRKPQFTGTWQFVAKEWGIESSMNLSIQSTTSIQLNLPDDSLVVALSLSANGKELMQGRDYGVEIHKKNALVLEWKAISTALNLKISYKLPRNSQVQTLPFVPVEGGTVKLLVNAESYLQTRLLIKPHEANVARFRQSLVSHREGWQIINPEPSLSGVPMFDIEIREREKVGVSAARILDYRIHYHYAGDSRIHGKAEFQISNPSGQFLSLRIPESAQLWQVMVENQSVRLAKTEDGLVLIPLKVSLATKNLSVVFRWEEALTKAESSEWQLSIPRPQLSLNKLTLTFTSAKELEFQPVPLSFKKQGRLMWTSERQGGLSDQPIRFKEVLGLEMDSSLPEWPYLEILILALCLLGTLKLSVNLQNIVLGIGGIGLVFALHPLAYLVMAWWFYTQTIRQSAKVP